MSKRHIAKMLVSKELLVQLLHLPESTKLISVVESDAPFYPRPLELCIEHDDLPEVGELETPLTIAPVFHRYEDGHVEMENWGIE